jgi:glucose/arabinose dehydrogenase
MDSREELTVPICSRAALWVYVAIALFGAATASAQADPLPPPQFEDALVTTVPRPTALAFTPDGRLLIARNEGFLYIHQNGTLLPPALDLSAQTCFNYERGMLGLAVDPSFTSNHYIYVFYTYKKQGNCETNDASKPVNRVSRFTLNDNNTISPSSELVLIDNIPSYSGSHNAGDLGFGKDGYLYVTVGDGFCDWRGDSTCGVANDAARDTSGLAGKVLRITKDGDIPPTNPFQGPNDVRCNVTGRALGTQQCREIYALGFRNPFRLAFDSNVAGTRVYINDVGQDQMEEVDLGEPGKNYGWNIREGHCWAGISPPDCGPLPAGWNLTEPIYDYFHDSEGCYAITAGAFVPIGIWPEQYDDAYLYSDLTCGKIFRLVPGAGGTFTKAEVVSGITYPITATFGPYGSTKALYYASWTGFPNDQIRRLAFTGQANRDPVARLTTNRTYGSLPLTVNFGATTSTDPDNDPLTYEWDFGDGSPHATGATASHTYTTAGVRTVTLTVRDDRNGQDTDTVQIYAGDNPPVPVIQSPSPSTTFHVGQQITLTGSASDPEQGTLPNSALTFEVIKRHDTHYHPFFPPTQGSGFQITAPPPEDINATRNSYLEIILTATDSQGLSSTVTQNLNPTLVDVTFQTSPTGLELVVAGSVVSGPHTITSWHGWGLVVDAPPQRNAGGQPMSFTSWSDGGAESHTITTGPSPASYTATFEPAGYARPKGASPSIIRLVPASRECTPQTANGEHGPPFDVPSCSPSQEESATLTVGTPDKNGFGANGTAHATLKVICTDSQNPPCPLSGETEDVSISISMTDVRCLSTNAACPGGPGSDYAGRVLATSALRMTDKLNGALGTGAGTAEDVPLDVPISCTSTTATTVGSTCSLSTTADALYPGVAQEQSRAVWQLGRFSVYDPGPNGTGYGGGCPPTCGDGDEKLYLEQGLFAP